jgi:hypothetical protein
MRTPTNNDLVLIIIAFFVSRSLVYIIGMVVVQNDNIVNTFCQWDCGWYTSVWAEGYYLQPNAQPVSATANWAFFPFFPYLARLLGELLGYANLTIAYWINNIAFFISVLLLYNYGKSLFNREIGFLAAIILLFFPMSLYFSVPYTESLFFLFCILFFWWARKGSWLLAGMAGTLAAATRNLGVFLVFPMLVFIIQNIKHSQLINFENKALAALLGLLIIPLGLFAYMTFLYFHVGDAYAFSNIQFAWGRVISATFYETIYGSLKQPWDSIYFLHTFGGLLLLAICLLGLKNKLLPEALFMVITILIPMMTSSVQGLPRYASCNIALYLILAVLLTNRVQLKIVLMPVFGLGLALVTIAWVKGLIHAT